MFIQAILVLALLGRVSWPILSACFLVLNTVSSARASINTPWSFVLCWSRMGDPRCYRLQGTCREFALSAVERPERMRWFPVDSLAFAQALQDGLPSAFLAVCLCVLVYACICACMYVCDCVRVCVCVCGELYSGRKCVSCVAHEGQSPGSR